MKKLTNIQNKRGWGRYLLAALLVLGTVLCCTGCQDSQETDGNAQQDHETVKIKNAQADREMTAAEQALCQALHSSYQADNASPFGSGAYLYHTLGVSGDALPEQQVYAVKELESLVTLSYTVKAMNKLDLPWQDTYNIKTAAGKNRSFQLFGLDFEKFMALCGADFSSKGLYLQCYSGAAAAPALEITWEDLKAGGKGGRKAVLAFGIPDKPLVASTNSEGYMDCCNNDGGPLRLVIPQAAGSDLVVDNLSKLRLSTQQKAADPGYCYHEQGVYQDSKNLTFTVNVYDKNQPVAAPLKAQTFTTAQLEALAKANPGQVFGNYYGTIGDVQSFQSMGIGGWLDYYQGLDLQWLLKTQVGVNTLAGSADFVDRDGLVYTTVADLSYLDNAAGNYEKYNVVTAEQVVIPNCRPLLAFAKNGYPLLPKHDHESAGYIAYNQLNAALEKAGVATEVGVVKNHSGPFVACLGNVAGLYGGYQVETGGDCIGINLYLTPEALAAMTAVSNQ